MKKWPNNFYLLKKSLAYKFTEILQRKHSKSDDLSWNIIHEYKSSNDKYLFTSMGRHYFQKIYCAVNVVVIIKQWLLHTFTHSF